MQAHMTQALPRLTLKNMHVMIDRKPHPIVNMNIQDVLIGGMPAACVGDIVACTGPTDAIVMGSFTVMFGGRPAAQLGSLTAHGGTVVMGYPMVLIG